MEEEHNNQSSRSKLKFHEKKANKNVTAIVRYQIFNLTDTTQRIRRKNIPKAEALFTLGGYANSRHVCRFGQQRKRDFVSGDTLDSRQFPTRSYESEHARLSGLFAPIVANRMKIHVRRDRATYNPSYLGYGCAEGERSGRVERLRH